jgi:hypothetical protein
VQTRRFTALFRLAETRFWPGNQATGLFDASQWKKYLDDWNLIMQFIRRYSVAVVLLVFLSLAACSPSLVKDITPPPQAQLPPAATAAPTENLAALPTNQPTSKAMDEPTGASSTAATLGTEGTFDIQGQITNGSGGNVPEDLTVVLQGYDNMQVAVTEEAQSAAGGSFSFSDIERVPDRVFVAVLEYDGILFGSDVVHAADIPENGSLDMSIPIYDHSSDISQLYADKAHLFLSFLAADRLQVMVYLLVSNPSNMVVSPAGADQPVLDFALPQDAANLQYEDSGMSQRYIQTSGGIGDMLEVMPGLQQHEILFSYEVPYTGKRELNFTFPIQVNSATVMMPVDKVKMSSPQLAESDTMSTSMGDMRVFSGDDLAVGDAFEINLSGRSSLDSSSGISRNLSLGIGLGAFAAVLVGAGIWINYRQKRHTVEPVASHMGENELLDAIVNLDDQYERGIIAPDEYESRRAELKEELRRVREEN